MQTIIKELMREIEDRGTETDESNLISNALEKTQDATSKAALAIELDLPMSGFEKRGEPQRYPAKIRRTELQAADGRLKKRCRKTGRRMRRYCISRDMRRWGK